MAPSAYTPITTTTGYECSTSQHRACGGKLDGSRGAAALTMKVVTTSVGECQTMTRRPSPGLGSSPSSTQIPGSARFGWLVSPQPAPWKSWPRGIGHGPNAGLQIVMDGRVVALLTPVSEIASGGPPRDTISETATSDGGRPYQRASPAGQPQKEIRKTMRTARDATLQPSISPPTCTSTCRRPNVLMSLVRGRSARKQRPAESELDRAIARGAARTAYVHTTLATGPRPERGPGGHSGHRIPPLETLQEMDEHSDNGNEGTATPSGETPPRPLEMGDLRDTPVMLARSVLVVSEKLTVACWRLVRPAFDPDSELRRRLEQGQSSWNDCLFFALAIAFVFLIVVAGVWTVRGIIWMALGVRFAVRACVFLIGF
ncbi:hypothetical protein QBC34DRAFT_158435 [Podospora aff. communis PSN243]|uniref:Uncharacterized protein n=1 Tax=Podospora aff. communis PSN243 TaxID=3040156 RepID=A0AAV9H216_9PEZI|nr:hypothetical protein QBC34DRAFT_158435 [Podospora aff. communis PSN243]